jgi:hypothetical protein
MPDSRGKMCDALRIREKFPSAERLEWHMRHSKWPNISSGSLRDRL